MTQHKKVDSKTINQLYDVFISLESRKDCEMLFEDLFTDKEIEQFAQRIEAAKLLISGKTYGQVIEKTDISSATLSRVSRCVQYGKGYTKFLKDN